MSSQPHTRLVSKRKRIVTSRLRCGRLALAQGEHAEAERVFKQALKEAEGFPASSTSAPYLIAAALMGLEDVYEQQGRQQDAEIIGQQLRTIIICEFCKVYEQKARDTDDPFLQEVYAKARLAHEVLRGR